MKIGFWSPVKGVAGVSSSSIAVALLASSSFGISCSLMQTSANGLNGLQLPLLGKQQEENSFFFDDVGVDAIMRHVGAGDRSQATIKDCCMRINSKLKYIPSTQRTKEIYEGDFIRYAEIIANLVSNFNKAAIFDIEAGTDAISIKMMHAMDLLVVCVPQNITAIEYLLSLNLPNEDIIYLYSVHDTDSYYNKKNLCRLYPLLAKKKSVTIPYCTQFRDSINQGNVMKFFDKNVGLEDKENELYQFFKESHNATNEILKAAGVLENIEEGGN